jgi:RNA polymerase sigma-70 factor (ECF subfamily)
MAALAPRQRLLLKQHVLDDLTIDEIGPLLKVHRATAARWLDQARSDLARATELALQRRLGVSTTEVKSALRLIVSQLDVSLRRLLSE